MRAHTRADRAAVYLPDWSDVTDDGQRVRLWSVGDFDINDAVEVQRTDNPVDRYWFSRVTLRPEGSLAPVRGCFVDAIDRWVWGVSVAACSHPHFLRDLPFSGVVHWGRASSWPDGVPIEISPVPAVIVDAMLPSLLTIIDRALADPDRIPHRLTWKETQSRDR